MTIPDKLLVTAVIPTRNRHQLVTHAVRSALRQTYRNLEVVVVIDGADPKTEESLSRLADSRLRVIALPESSGPAAARNIGVAAARGEWIAFLDDDDQWLPEKIELQMAIA
ncbi:MAG: glycosyltransferase family 2 protein, partial [Candidatus Acidiferrum sp.]